MTVGPLQVLVIGFGHPDLRGEIVAELQRLRERDTVRVVDALGVRKDAAGRLEFARLSHLSDGEAEELGRVIGAEIGRGYGGTGDMDSGARIGAEAAKEDGVHPLSGDDAAWEILADIPADSAAVLLLLEHRWAAGLRDKVARAGGFRISDGVVGPLDLPRLGVRSAREARTVLALELGAASSRG